MAELHRTEANSATEVPKHSRHGDGRAARLRGTLERAWPTLCCLLLGACYSAHPLVADDGGAAAPGEATDATAHGSAGVHAAISGNGAVSSASGSAASELGGAQPPTSNLGGGISHEPLAPVRIAPEPNLRVAFLGDQGVATTAHEVLELVKREGAALVVHAGDLSYAHSEPLEWEARINAVLGPAFPYVVVVGNHDLDDWEGPEGFAAVLTARLDRTAGLRCNGELGVQSLCRFRGLELVLSGVGTRGDDHDWYLERTLARPGALARLCVWHKNQHDMQVGTKPDQVGWAAYQLCARHGAPIITGHEHSYSRTFTLTAIGDRSRGHGAIGSPELVRLAPGSTFVAVTGLGGQGRRSRTLDHAHDTWWATIYANDYQMLNGKVTGSDPRIQFGALFIDFHVDGDPHKARAYFKTIDDDIVDHFELRFEQPKPSR